jgi:hypothetical protein
MARTRRNPAPDDTPPGAITIEMMTLKSFGERIWQDRQDNLYWIPDANLDKLYKKLDKLSVFAEQSMSKPLTWGATGAVEYREIEPKQYARYTQVLVKGPAPKFHGWEFVAKLQHSNAGNIVRAMPGKELPPEYFNATSSCEHCASKRRRTYTYVVFNEGSGQYMQLGSSCLADFLGHGDPEQIAQMAEFLTTLDSDVSEYSSGGNADLTALVQVLELSAAAVRLFGWVSSQNANEKNTSTSSRVANQIWPPIKKEYRDPRIEVSGEDKEIARAAIEWARNLKPSSGYENNISVIAKEEFLPKRTFGLAVSIILAYQRAAGQRAGFQPGGKPAVPQWKLDQQRMAESSRHVGTIGQRVDLRLFVDKVFARETNYGTSFIIKMHDENWNSFTWFSSNQLDEGVWYDIRATIKAHDEYQGTKQTVITRGDAVEAN